MNTRKLHHSLTLVALLALVLLVPAAARAALNTDSATIAAKATLIRPLTIDPLSPIEFGTLIKGSLTGPVTVAMDPRLSQGPTVISSNPSAVMVLGGYGDGGFDVNGEPGSLVQVSHPASIVLKKGAGGSAATEMTLNNFNIDVNVLNSPTNLYNDATKQFTMPSTGVARLEAGGTLTVEDNDEYGAYSGSFTVTVTYL
jgi:hypothetical protein